MHRVFIEGNISAGKTTLCEGLKASGHNVIDEWFTYLDSETEFIPSQPDVESLAASARVFADVEARRLKDADKQRTTNGLAAAVFDRGPLSSLGYLYATRGWYEHDLMEYLLDRLMETAPEMLDMSGVIEMTIPFDVMLSRSQVRDIAQTVFAQPTFIRRLDAFYQTAREVLGVPWLVIDSRVDDKDIVLEKAGSFLESIATPEAQSRAHETIARLRGLCREPFRA